MRPGFFITVAGGLVAIGFLGFRILDLEQRVARLSEQLGTPEPSGAPVVASSGTSSSTSAARGYQQRLSSLEEKLDKLLRASTQRAPDPSQRTLARDQDILSVIERENSRIRDVQLEWHRGRWLEGRENQLAQFAAQQQLTGQQTDALRQALEMETDRMISVLKKPGLAEDPDQAASDWLNVLRETDERASKVLTPEQEKAWGFVRFVERRTFWPWLPEQATASR